MEHNSHTRRIRRRKRRKKWNVKRILFVIFILILLVIGYTGFQFAAGKNEAQNKVQADGNGLNEISSQYKDDFKGVKSKDGKTRVLLLGSDQRGEEAARSDTIIIAQFDPKKGTAKMASVMRDTYVNIPGHGYNKINAAFAFGGPELLRKTISENFGVDLEYYAIVDFNGFIQITNTLAPDGLKVNVEENMKYKDGSGTIDLDLKKGKQTLEGEDLLGYARYRYGTDGDFGRVRRQQKVIKLLENELVSVNGVIKAPRLLGNIGPYLDTNMEGKEILSLGKSFLLNPVDDIQTASVPDQNKVWPERKEYPVGLVVAHNEAQTKQDIQAFLHASDTSESATGSGKH